MLYLKIVTILILYYLSAYFGLKMDAIGGFASLVWPPSGIALAALLLLGKEVWPGVFLGALLVNFFHGASFLSAAGIGIGNTLEAIVATHLLTRWQDFHKNFDRLKDVLVFIILGCAFSSIFSATIGVLSLWLFGDLKEATSITWRAWWTGDALGMLIITPLILCWGTFRMTKFNWWKILELIFLLSTMLIAGSIVFSKNTYMVFWFFPFVMWAAISFGQVGNVTVVFILSIMAIWGTSHDLGPFARSYLRDNLFLLNSFMAVMTSTGMMIAAAFTERKNAMEELQHALQSRDEFLSIASHELKTPLTSLSLQLQLVRSANSPERLDKALELSLKQVGRLSDLIGNLLNVSLMRTGRFQYHFEEINLSKVITNMSSRYEDQMQKAQCTFSYEIQENIFGSFDSLRIEQVMDNLLSNAIKYARCNAVKVSLSTNDKDIILIVEDDGPGIPASKHQKIFEKYERVSQTDSISGLGLGLFIVKDIIVSHHGNIKVQNKVEGGAKFTITFHG